MVNPMRACTIADPMGVLMTAVEPEPIEEMLIRVAKASTVPAGVLTLTSVGPATRYLSDPPERAVVT